MVYFSEMLVVLSIMSNKKSYYILAVFVYINNIKFFLFLDMLSG